MIAGVLGIGMAIAGCEQRVVGVHNPYIGSQVVIQPAPGSTVQQRGILDDLWAALFGWTKPAPATNAVSTQPSIFRPNTVQSSGQ